jgi:hypothetical protein
MELLDEFENGEGLLIRDPTGEESDGEDGPGEEELGMIGWGFPGGAGALDLDLESPDLVRVRFCGVLAVYKKVWR